MPLDDQQGRKYVYAAEIDRIGGVLVLLKFEAS